MTGYHQGYLEMEKSCLKYRQVIPSTSTSALDVQIGMTVAGMMPTLKVLHAVRMLAYYVALPTDKVAEKLEGWGRVRRNRFARQTGSDNVSANGANGDVGSPLIQALHDMGHRVKNGGPSPKIRCQSGRL
ncbi:hypothetical protein M434DRAFT_18319 [Hypoxylon sp. CO27-5]|nr:hypothetical protein M434DRAFT_18319 [Hypoxylon sp. CO27-5]